MADADPFEGLGKALVRLRKRAGFSTQTEASDVLKIDKGQLSRWEHDVPRPTLENLGRLLAGYGATVVDLGYALAEITETEPKPRELGPPDEELIRELTDAIRRVEGRQNQAEDRLDQIEKDLSRPIRPAATSSP